jgi:uncharacterized membrane protein YdjX (TVP38/TMEM64 family)
MSMRIGARPLLLLALLALVLAFYLFGWHRYLNLAYIHEHLDQWRRQADEYPLLACSLFLGVYVAVTGLSLPGAGLLSLTAGALFGRWLGAALALTGATLGASLAFLSSRYLFREWVERRFGPRLEAIDCGVQREGSYFLFTLRLMPYVPFFLINLGMGLTAMPLRTFVGVSLAGMVPGCLVYANAGQALREITRLSDILTPPILIAFILLGVLPLLLHRLLPRRKEEPTT